MALIETESLVLKSYNLAEADKIVVILTRDHGVIRGVAKGAKRLKSRFGSGLEPYSEVVVTYFQKDAVELVSIQKVELVRSYFAAASNPDFLQKFSYLGELVITMSPPHDPNETLYRMVKACIETAAADQANLLSVGVYFELWLLRISGYLPDWTTCDECGRTFENADLASVRSNFHLICSACRRAASSKTLSGPVRMMALSAMKIAPLEFARSFAGRDDDLKYISKILKQLISHSIGREVAGEKSLAISK